MGMTKMMCRFLILCSIFAIAASGDVETLNKYSKIYEDNILKYDTNYRFASQAWSIEYIKKLQNLQSKYQSSGNLNSWDAATKELKRYKSDLTLVGATSSIPEIRKLQSYYRDHAEKLLTDKETKSETLRRQYITRLKALQKEYTQKGDFDAAHSVRDEIERVGGDTKTELNRSESSRASMNVASDVKQNSSPVADKPKTLADGTIVYPPGVRAPVNSKRNYKLKTMLSTKNASWASSVILKLWESSEKDSDRFERDLFVGNMDGRVKSDARYVRIGIRMTKPDETAKDLQIQIEYYSKPASGSGDAKVFTRKIVPIEDVDSRVIYADVAPVSIDSLSRSIRLKKSGEHTKTVGDKFYGYIVTVLDSQGGVLYQSASSGTLAKSATVPNVEKDNSKHIRRNKSDRPIIYGGGFNHRKHSAVRREPGRSLRRQ